MFMLSFLPLLRLQALIKQSQELMFGIMFAGNQEPFHMGAGGNWWGIIHCRAGPPGPAP